MNKQYAKYFKRLEELFNKFESIQFEYLHYMQRYKVNSPQQNTISHI